MRLIDADDGAKIIEDIRERMRKENGVNPFIEIQLDDFKRILQRAPTVDAVPVVRCRYCKYAEPCPGAPLAFRCRLSGRTTTFDFYCAEGVKKE